MQAEGGESRGRSGMPAAGSQQGKGDGRPQINAVPKRFPDLQAWTAAYNNEAGRREIERQNWQQARRRAGESARGE